MQKLASGGAGAPQFPHRSSSWAPHAMQKRAAGGFSVAQLWQMATAIAITVVEIQPPRGNRRGAARAARRLGHRAGRAQDLDLVLRGHLGQALGIGLRKLGH